MRAGFVSSSWRSRHLQVLHLQVLHLQVQHAQVLHLQAVVAVSWKGLWP
ncbi:MAG TPA: hypothetical protein VN033_12365 [Vulgatibacter sp.]|nr:hypothetical protein [Vulgatibacter sp.]